MGEVKKEEVLFYHGVTTDGYRFTLAGRYLVKSDESMAYLVTGISVCSKEDHFVRKTGRLKAQGRSYSRSIKGSLTASLYSHTDFTADKPHASFSKNWFKGKEISVFNQFAKKLEMMNKKEVLEKYHFYRRDHLKDIDF